MDSHYFNLFQGTRKLNQKSLVTNVTITYVELKINHKFVRQPYFKRQKKKMFYGKEWAKTIYCENKF